MFNLVYDLPSRELITRFFNDDGMVVVGWEDTKEEILCVGSNTELNRQIGDFVADCIKHMVDYKPSNKS